VNGSRERKENMRSKSSLWRFGFAAKTSRTASATVYW
jgi:hypothetical protein